MKTIRKELIEILEPYMTKTLGEGCWIEWKTGDVVKLGEWDTYGYIAGKGYLEPSINKGDYKILGHIGITAVLKYIQQKGYELDFFSSIINIHKGNKSFLIGRIQYKELHLYTEQELEELYFLLKDLGKLN